MCMHSALIGGEQQASFLMKAYDMGLTKGRYVFLPYDTLLYSLPYSNTTYFPLQNNTKLRQAYDAVLTVTMESDLMSFNEAFKMAKWLGELTVSQEPQQVWRLQYNAHFRISLTIKIWCKVFMRDQSQVNQYFSGLSTLWYYLQQFVSHCQVHAQYQKSR